MRIADTDILILPGLGNSGPGHWQLRWAEKMSTAAIVEQADWDDPDPEDWVDTIVPGGGAGPSPGGAGGPFSRGVCPGARCAPSCRRQGTRRLARVAARPRVQCRRAGGRAELCPGSPRSPALSVAARDLGQRSLLQRSSAQRTWPAPGVRISTKRGTRAHQCRLGPWPVARRSPHVHAADAAAVRLRRPSSRPGARRLSPPPPGDGAQSQVSSGRAHRIGQQLVRRHRDAARHRGGHGAHHRRWRHRLPDHPTSPSIRPTRAKASGKGSWPH